MKYLDIFFKLIIFGFWCLPIDAKADLPAIVTRLKSSVVLVGVYSATDNPRFSFRGTGFVVQDGNHVITNAHVLPELGGVNASKQMAVQVWASSTLWTLRLATLTERDVLHDLALLRFEGIAAPAVTLDLTPPREGATIGFMGFPLGGALGFSHVTHRGIISSIAAIALPAPTSQQLTAQALHQLRSGPFEILQLDAVAYPGNSGGPIFDGETGNVIGVINSVLVKGSRESALTQPSGISYGIPVIHVERLLKGKSE